MAKKKTAKKVAKKTTNSTEQLYSYKGILALIIIILAWWKPAIMWSQITITIAAALILISGDNYTDKKK